MKATPASDSGDTLRFSLVAIATGGALLAVILALATPAAGWGGILTAALYGLTLALGGTLFASLHLLAGARWWDRLRPVTAALAAVLPVPTVFLVLALAAGQSALYPWAEAGASADPLLARKEAWLNPPFFLARAALILVLWFVVLSVMRRKLRRQHERPTVEGAIGLRRTAVAFLVVLGVTISVAFWDWGMSLEPEWFSTIYGVYGFAGTLQAGIAAVAFISLALGRRPGGGNEVRVAERHFLGTLLFAFSMFWAYIWISQYLLIWYSDLPEEAVYYVRRLSGGWSMLMWLDLLLNFAVPFVVLLPSTAKKSANVLLQVSIAVLVGHWLDLYLLVAPATAGTASLLPAAALGATASVVAGGVLIIRKTLADWPETAVGEAPGAPSAGGAGKGARKPWTSS